MLCGPAVYKVAPSDIFVSTCVSSPERQKQAELAKSREEASRAAQEKRELEERLKTEAEKTQQAFNKHKEERKRALIAERAAARHGLDMDTETYAYSRGAGPPKLEALPPPDLKERYRAIKKRNAENPRLDTILKLIAVKTGKTKSKVKVPVSDAVYTPAASVIYLLPSGLNELPTEFVYLLHGKSGAETHPGPDYNKDCSSKTCFLVRSKGELADVRVGYLMQ